MSRTLQFNPDQKHSVDRLPFVDPGNGSLYQRYWSVPATGGAFGGLRTGRALAMLYLKQLRNDPDERRSTLCWIVRSMYIRYYIEGGEDAYSLPYDEQSTGFKSIDAQLMGFFGVLEERLRMAVPLMSDLDRHPEKTLLAVANEGLAHADEWPAR